MIYIFLLILAYLIVAVWYAQEACELIIELKPNMGIFAKIYICIIFGLAWPYAIYVGLKSETIDFDSPDTMDKARERLDYLENVINEMIKEVEES